MNAKIEDLIQKAIALLDNSWERCDKETGKECRGPLCEIPTHRVMILLCDISNENKK